MAGVKKPPKTARKKAARKKTGRPRVRLDHAKLAALFEDHATDAEISAELGVSVRTLERRRATDAGFRELQSKALATASLSLKRAMWTCALSCADVDPLAGATSMAIFWAKQSIERGGLGFSDRAVVATTDAGLDGDVIDAELADKVARLTAREQAKKQTRKRTPKASG